MTRTSIIKLLIVFAIALSFSSLPGPLSSHFSVPTVRAAPQPAQVWYPGGPAFDFWRPSIFLDEATEFINLQQPTPSIDVTDWPLTAAVQAAVCPQAGFFCTSKINDTGYFELEFNLANNFWGINFDYGNSTTGQLIRQGIAHLIDKPLFVQNQADISGFALAMDTAVPIGSSFQGHPFVSPNVCSWDLNFTESGAACGLGGPGGTGYNCKVGATCPTGTVITAVNFAWQPSIGSANFCAAATHFKDAFNRVIPGGGVTLNANCVLLPPGSTTPDTAGTVWSAKVPGWSSVNMFARIDHHPRLQLGQSIAQELCGLFTGALTTSCGNVVGGVPLIVSETEGTITSFPGFTTDPTRLALTWHLYTAGFGSVFPFDSAIFSAYHSEFVDSYFDATKGFQPLAQAHGGHCSNVAVPSFGPSDYQYACNQLFDRFAFNTEFAPCLQAPGDVDTQIGHSSATLVNCPSTSQTTALGSALQASDVHGKFVLTLPIYTDQTQFAYLSNWQRVVSHLDSGFQSSFAELNAWTPNPASLSETPSTLTIRQGFKQTTRALNPYISTTVWDFFIIGFRTGSGIYDTLAVENPANPGDSIEWMTADPSGPTEFKCSGGVCPGLGYTPPAGTVDNFRFTLRGDLFWQDASSHPTTGFVSAWDVKYTYTTMLANGAFQSTGIAPMLCNAAGCTDGITVKGPRQFDIHLSATGPFTLPGLGSLTILPGRLWSTCSTATWDAGVTGGNVPDSCMSANSNKLLPQYDPSCNDSAVCPANPAPGGTLIGSGAWTCVDSFHGTNALGGGCSSSGKQGPQAGGSYTLRRFGFGTGAPGTAPSNRIYFRSSSNQALWIWSNDNGGARDSGNLVAVLACQNAAVAGLVGGAPGIPNPNLGFPNGCAHWQQGIGNPLGPGGHAVGPAQIVIAQLYLGVRWVAPEDWTGTFGTVPAGIAPFPPVLYEGSYVSGGTTIRPTLNPANIAFCGTPFDPSSATSGGYDC